MTTTATFANTDNTLVRFTVNGVTNIVPADYKGEFRDGIGGVVGFLAKGGAIGPYVAPVIDLDALDTAALNAALIEPGTVVRALAEVVFLISKGSIAIDPARTKTQFVALLKARMR